MTYLQLCSEVGPFQSCDGPAYFFLGAELPPPPLIALPRQRPRAPALSSQDYHWWWRSFIISGGSAVYVLLYSTFYYSSKLDIDDSVSTILYFGYTGLMVLVFWILTGALLTSGGRERAGADMGVHRGRKARGRRNGSFAPCWPLA